MNVKSIVKRGEPLPPQEENKESIESLKNQIASLKMANKHLYDKCSQLSQKADHLDKILSRQERLQSTTKFVIAFLRFVKPFSSTVAIVGSFVRKLFEFLYLLPRSKTNDWIGNIQNLEISCVFNMSHSLPDVERVKNQEKYLEMISAVQTLKESSMDTYVCKDIHFNCVKNVCEFPDRPVSNCTMIFKHGSQQILLTVYAYLPMSLLD